MKLPARITPTLALLAISVAGLFVGSAAHLAGASTAGDAIWAVTAVAALVPTTVSMVRTILRRSPGVDVIAVLAIAGSLALGEFLAGAVMALMIATGAGLEEYAASRAERELKSLLSRTPRFARRLSAGSVEVVPVDAVVQGDVLVINEGDIVPVDGQVLEGIATLDESALTGESRPVERAALELVRSGVVNAGASFQLRAVSTAEASTYAGIIRMVREAQSSKAPMERLADRYALLFVPLTLAVAAAAWAVSGSAVRALAVLVVATPCPLLLAAPVAVISGVSRAARRGIVVKGGAAIETLARAEVAFLDKTGTITRGSPDLQRIAATGPRWREEEILRAAASLDQLSSHVFADALVRVARRRGVELSLPTGVREQAGAGIEGTVDGHAVRAGNLTWVSGPNHSDASVRFGRRLARMGGSAVFVSIDGELAGAVVFDDPIRADAARAIRVLKRLGFSDVTMLTGDRVWVAEAVGAALGVDHVLAELSPAEKVAAVVDASRDHVTLMVGDGINDAPALAAASVGIAMGARGAASSSEAADIVLVVDRLDRLVSAVQIARRSRTIAVQSIVLGMGLSFVAMGFAAFGFLPPVVGAFLQEAIDAAAILNALRALGGPDPSRTSFRLPADAAATLRREHDQISAKVERLREFADGVTEATPEALAQDLQALSATVAEILAHEEADEAEVYREITAGMAKSGAEDPLAAMSRTHHEIFLLARSFVRLIQELDGASPEPEDIVDLRRTLYALHALLRLNIAQEEELYLSLDPTWAGD